MPLAPDIGKPQQEDEDEGEGKNLDAKHHIRKEEMKQSRKGID